MVRPIPRSLRWLAWSTVGFGLQGVGQFVVLAVLARYLSKADFGVVMATLIVVGLGRLFTQAVVGPAVVQREELTPAHVRSAFSLSLIGGLIMVAGLWLLAPAIASFFEGMAGHEDVIRALSLVFVLQAPGVVPEALLQRDLNFRALALSEAASFLLGFVPLGVVLAVEGFGVWALVAAYVGQVLFKSIAVMAMRSHERSLIPDLMATRDLLYFGGGFLTARIFSYSGSQADNLVVGRWMTVADLGVYGRAYQLMTMPAMLLGEVMDRVLFPYMARFQTDRPRLRDTYGRGVSLIASIMTPAAVIGVILAPEIVRVVLGPDWDSVIVPFQILATGLVFRTGYKISDSLSRATGTVYARAWRQAVFAGLVFFGALIGQLWGLAGVSVGIVLAIGGNYVLMAQLSVTTIGWTWGHFLAVHRRGLLSGSVVGAITWTTAESLRQRDAGTLLVLIASMATAAIAVAAGAVLAPQMVLGRDGLWMLRKLTGSSKASA